MPEEAKKSTFKLKSGNSPLFKQMGSSPAKHGTTNDFLYGRNGHNPDIMEGSHEDWHTDRIKLTPEEKKEKGEVKEKPSPNKQKRVKRKTEVPSSGNTYVDEYSEKDLAKWKESKNATLRFLEKNTDESGKINPNADYLGEWKKQKIKQHLKEITKDAIKKSKDKNKPIV